MGPVYRGTREFNNATDRNRRKPSKTNDTYKLIQVNADINFNNTKDESKSDERKRRRLVSRNNYSINKPTSTSTTTTTTTAQVPVETTSTVEIIKQEIQPLENIKQEKLTDQLENFDQIDPSILKETENLPPVRRFYRSSAETQTEKEITIINNEKVHIVRPTSQTLNNFEVPKSFDTLRPYSSRFKKEAITIVVPTKYRRNRS